MGDVIDFSNAPLSKLRHELNQKQTECEAMRQELSDTKNKLATLVSVNEMLRIQLNDLAGMLTMFQHQLSGMVGNINGLRQKLPHIDSRLRGVRTQDRPPEIPEDDE